MADEFENALPAHMELLAVRIGHHQRGNPFRPLPFTGGPGTLPGTGHRAHLLGWSVVETTGAAVAVLTIVNGTTAGAPPLAPINLAAGGFSSVMIGRPGVIADGGLAVVVASGAVSGVLYYELAR